MITGFLVGVGVGIVAGGWLAYWFEDVLRGPIVRAYSRELRLDEPVSIDE